MADERMQNNEPDINQLRKVRREKLKGLQAEGKDPFRITVFDQEHHTEQVKAMFLAEEAKEQPETLQVTLAGRLMQKRVMGKASFCNLQDRDGNIQVYATRDMLGEEPYAAFKKLDVGDIVGVKGEMFRTEKGEITVRAKEITLLSKSLQILPEKYHGLTNTDIRYRQRYVDLIMNPEVKDTFIKRSKIISAIRRYLDARDFMEVETPMLVENAGGAAARPFVTHFNALDEDKKLRISLELYLKRLIVGGLERVYEIGRVFRNEGLDIKHNPEFTLMELYQAYTDYEGMMRLTEDMYRTVAQEVLGTTVLNYKGQTIDIGKPWKRMTMTEAVKEYSGVDFDAITTLEEARAAAKEKNVEIQERHSIGEIMNEFFDAYVEDNLIQPTFITNHPIEISPLTKKDPQNPGKVLRFEMFMNGWEMCNAYSELNDPIDQRERFKAQEAQLAAGNEEANTTDEDFLNALEIGMPPTGGIGYGIDRMVMLFTGAEAIRDVLLFPTMKQQKTGSETQKTEKAAESKAEAKTEEFECACFTCPSQEACKAAQEAEKAAPCKEHIDFTGVEIEPLFKDYVDFETFSRSDFRVVKVLACEAVPKSKKLLKFTLDDGTGTERIILSGIHAFYEPEELVGKTLVAITNLPPRPMMGLESCGMLLSALHKVNGEERLNLLMVDPHMPAGAKLY